MDITAFRGTGVVAVAKISPVPQNLLNISNNDWRQQIAELNDFKIDYFCIDQAETYFMQSTIQETTAEIAKETVEKTVFSILLTISFTHLLNDTIQSLIPSIYPIVKDSFHLSFSQIGLITLTFQLTASIFQPLVGYYTDKHPQPYSLPVAMGFALIGLLLMAAAGHFSTLLFSVGLIGVGSSIFHPEASKIAYMASGGRRGLAQSIFQVGGNTGSSLGPLLAALIIVPLGQPSIAWFALLALTAICVLFAVSSWHKKNINLARVKVKKIQLKDGIALSKNKIAMSIVILLVLIFSKYFYIASITSYFTFYVMHRFHLSVGSAQLHLFMFLAAVAAGTFFGGPLGDRFGRKYVIWFSILGAAPFTLVLPYVGLLGTSILIIIIGFILASAFSAILVYAQELLPGKIGMVSGLFFGFAFGMGGLGSAALGALADHTSIEFVYQVCAYLPLLGLLTGLLPDIGEKRKKIKKNENDPAGL